MSFNISLFHGFVKKWEITPLLTASMTAFISAFPLNIMRIVFGNLFFTSLKKSTPDRPGIVKSESTIETAFFSRSIKASSEFSARMVSYPSLWSSRVKLLRIFGSSSTIRIQCFGIKPPLRGHCGARVDIGRMNRQLNRKCRSLPDLALDRYLAFMFFKDSISDIKTEPGSLSDCFGCKKWIEYFL